jgi:hypothetical protein
MAEIKRARKSLFGKPEGKWLLGKASLKRGDSKVDHKMDYECVNCVLRAESS